MINNAKFDELFKKHEFEECDKYFQIARAFFENKDYHIDNCEYPNDFPGYIIKNLIVLKKIAYKIIIDDTDADESIISELIYSNFNTNTCEIGLEPFFDIVNNMQQEYHLVIYCLELEYSKNYEMLNKITKLLSDNRFACKGYAYVIPYIITK